MTAPEIGRIGIVGAGRMGTDLALFMADAGLELSWICRDANEAAPLGPRITARVERRAAADLIDPATARSTIEALHIGYDPAALAACDLVLEAIPEDRTEKERLLSSIDALLPPSSILSTNSSSLKPQDLWTSINRRNRFVGLHFFFPLKLRRTVEFLVTEDTDPALIVRVDGFLRRCGLVPLRLGAKTAFAVNRTMLDVQARAAWLLQDGLSPADIDAMTDLDFFPGGIFSMMDAIGIDVLAPSVAQYTAGEDPAFYAPLVEELSSRLSRGALGLKSGSGFYRYDGRTRIAPACSSTVSERDAADYRFLLRALYVNRAWRFIESGSLAEREFDQAMADVMGTTDGPLALGDAMGRHRIAEVLARHHAADGFGPLRPSPCLNQPQGSNAL